MGFSSRGEFSSLSPAAFGRSGELRRSLRRLLGGAVARRRCPASHTPLHVANRKCVRAQLTVFIADCLDLARLDKPDERESAHCLRHVAHLGADWPSGRGSCGRIFQQDAIT